MPTLTPYTDDDPSPRVTALFTAAELSSSVATITVVATSTAGEYIVRNGERINAVGGAVITDYEAPLGIPVSYRARQFSSLGADLGLSPAASATISIDPGYVIIQDFLAPSRAVRVDADAAFAAEVSTSRAAQRYRAGESTIVLMGEMGLSEDIDVRVSTRTLEQADNLLRVLAEGTVLLRTMPGVVRIPQLFYCAIPTVKQIPIDVQWGGGWVRWELSADEMSRPDLNVLEPVFTNQRYMSFYTGTNASVMAAYTTNLAAVRNPPPEV